MGLDPNVRLYHIAGAHHLFFRSTDKGMNRYELNALNYQPLLRALLVALDEWVSGSQEPPASCYPRLADKTLLDLPTYRTTFPAIPGVDLPEFMYAPRRLDPGPRWASEGVADYVPPQVGESYRTLVPAVDADGNELAGIRLPDVAVPLGTNVGWNLRAERFGAPKMLTRWWGGVLALPANG